MKTTTERLFKINREKLFRKMMVVYDIEWGDGGPDWRQLTLSSQARACDNILIYNNNNNHSSSASFGYNLQF